MALRDKTEFDVDKEEERRELYFKCGDVGEKK